MFEIKSRRDLNEAVFAMQIEAPDIAKRAKAGQFVILRADEEGERIPLTVADTDRVAGTVTIIFQVVGGTTKRLSMLHPGDSIPDFVGPLGHPTDFADARRVCVVGGGVGCAIAFPQAKALHAMGVHVDVIAGFRSKDIVILEEEFRANSAALYITTDDGSYGDKGFVTTKLEELIAAGGGYDLVIAIGPVVMMKFVSEVTRKQGIRTLVSLNPIMVDGTGMCGCCRVTVGGELRFACVDGPDFDGHLVDYDELMNRNRFYIEQEKEDYDHVCKIGLRGNH